MTSVLAVRQKAWVVFYIGTGDGQLIKLAVDKNYHTTCPRVLYRANDDRQVFPKIQLDQVDHKHVYVPFKNQMKRVPVSKCSTYTNVQDCWSAQDPYCVWCGSKRSCTFEDECQDSDWLSIPDDSQQKMVSYKVVKDSTGQITLNIKTHMTVGQKTLSNFACQFSTSSRELCRTENPPPQFQQCTCVLSDSTLPAEGLAVTVTIRLGTTQLLEQLKLTNCTDIRGPPTSVLCQQCIEAGCGWSTNGCSWATEGVMKDSVCQMMESGMTFSRPEISSITPSVVSFYGRNRAMLSGSNLSDVTRVRIQAKDCTPKESPVWNNSGMNLMFHIPPADIKGVVKVCVVLPDGSCHGNSKITYRSLPSCTNITPSSTWISGKRRITLTGSHLEFVEGVVHSHALQEVRPPRNHTHQKKADPTNTADDSGESCQCGAFREVNNSPLPTQWKPKETRNETEPSLYPLPPFNQSAKPGAFNAPTPSANVEEQSAMKTVDVKDGDDVRITHRRKKADPTNTADDSGESCQCGAFREVNNSPLPTQWKPKETRNETEPSLYPLPPFNQSAKPGAFNAPTPSANVEEQSAMKTVDV
ncbi:plexin-C1-like [Morone saxatilis]|uniref:plexin-C1-like n=1 Tax=Morone saxatilis TaxID=34816 RepID=UPI0015E1D57A|nr:plexin-C1-like [Morone saxatilis]